MNKPGIKTTEFWLTVLKASAGLFLAFGVTLGLFTPDVASDKEIENLVGSIAGYVVAIAGLFVSSGAIKEYTRGRTNLKCTEVSNGSESIISDVIGFGIKEEYDDEEEFEDGAVDPPVQMLNCMEAP